MRAVAQRRDVSLRDPNSGGPKKQWNIRLPPAVMTYVRSTAKASGRSMTSVVINALELERILEARLGPHKAHIQMFAEEQALDLSGDFPRVIAELAIHGLACLDKKPKK